MRNQIAAGIKPNSSLSLPAGESACLVKCVGGDGAIRTMTALSKGNPTVVTFSAMPTNPFLAGQMLAVGAIVVTGGSAVSSISNTYQRIKWVDTVGKRIALDVDTGADNWSGFTSGTVISNVLYDQFGTLAPSELLLTGTYTNAWADQASGLKPDTTVGGVGNPTARNTTNAFFNMPSMGRVAFSFTVKPGATPGASEMFFCLNRDGLTGSNSAAGVIFIGYYGANLNPVLYFLPKTGTDNTAANTGTESHLAVGAMTAGTTYVCQWILDFDTNTAYAYRDGAYVGSVALTQTNSTGNPVIGQGAVFFGGLNNAAGSTVKLNAAATTSSATVINNCLIWKTQKSLTETVRILNRFGRTGEFPTYML